MNKSDMQEYTLIKLVDIKNNNYIRSFYTKNPLTYLKQYKYMEENEISIYINDDEETNDNYADNWGDIEFIEVGFGGKYTYPYIKVYVEVRDYP